MKKFKYRALKQDGSRIEGEFEGNTKDAVMTMITSNGYYPLKIDEVIQSKEIQVNIGGKVKARDLAVFCRQMHTMLDAGVTITNCLSILEEQVVNKKLKAAIVDISEGVKKGEMLSDAMKRHGDVFPQLIRSMIASGEMSGNLDEMMLRLSVHYEKENKTAGKVKAAMVYPIILAIVCIVVVNFILIYIMPTFASVFDQDGAELPRITKILLGLSSFMTNNILIILLVVAGIIGGIVYYRQTENGKYFFSKLKLNFPIVRGLTKKIIVSRFTRTLSTLLASGVSLIQALPIVSGVLNNKIAEDAMADIRERVARGEGLTEPIRQIPIFPPMLSSMVKIGEEAGSLDEMLEKTADFYDEEVDQEITRVTSMLEPLLIVVMGITVGVMVIGIMLPMFDMYDHV